MGNAFKLKNNGIYARNPIYLEKSYFIIFFQRRGHLNLMPMTCSFIRNIRLQSGGHMFTTDYGKSD